MKKHTARIQVHRLPPVRVYEGDRLVQIASEPMIQEGPTFAWMRLASYAPQDDLLMTATQAQVLRAAGEVEVESKGHTFRLVTA